MKNKHAKKEKWVLQLAIVLSLLFFVTALANAGVFNFSIGGKNVSIQTPTVTIYNAYKTFMSWVSAGAYEKSLPSALATRLDPYFNNNVSEVKYAYASRLGSVSITDCTKIYFGAKTMADAISKNSLTGTQMFVLLHELAHTEQCYVIGGREAYANMWFKDLNIALSTLSSASNAKTIHDKMPMEKAAASKALEVQNALAN